MTAHAKWQKFDSLINKTSREEIEYNYYHARCHGNLDSLKRKFLSDEIIGRIENNANYNFKGTCKTFSCIDIGLCKKRRKSAKKLSLDVQINPLNGK